MSPNTPLDIQDYLDAASDSAKRARAVSFLLVVASIVVFAGLLNSLQSSWMLTRINKLNNTADDYVISKLGHSPTPPAKASDKSVEFEMYQKRYEQLYSAYARTYVENTFVIRVPFFGFTFDVNDLGLLGGLAFLILLTILRFCLSREINNLDLTFAESSRLRQLRELYTLLAMRQVLTVPQTPNMKRKKFLLIIPKVLCFLPLFVHAAVTFHDILTMDLFDNLWHTKIIIISDIVLLIAIVIVSLMVVTRLMRIDLIWASSWIAILQDEEQKRQDKSDDNNVAQYTQNDFDGEFWEIWGEWKGLLPKKPNEKSSAKGGDVLATKRVLQG